MRHISHYRRDLGPLRGHPSVIVLSVILVSAKTAIIKKSSQASKPTYNKLHVISLEDNFLKVECLKINAVTKSLVERIGWMKLRYQLLGAENSKNDTR